MNLRCFSILLQQSTLFKSVKNWKHWRDKKYGHKGRIHQEKNQEIAKKKLLKIRKENRIKEITNEMHEVLNGKIISIDMNLFYLNNESYIIKKNLQLIRETMKENGGDEGSTSNVPQSTPSITMTSMMTSPIIDPPFTAMTPQMDPVAEIPSMGASIQMNNYQNSADIPQSPSFTYLLNLNDDDFITLLDDLSLSNASDQDSNPSNNK